MPPLPLPDDKYLALVQALAEGLDVTQAAARACVTTAAAAHEASVAGWPDLAAVRATLADLDPTYTTPTPASAPGDAPMARRRTRTPAATPPVEPDVEETMAAGAASTQEARAAVAVEPAKPADLAELATSKQVRDAAAEEALAEAAAVHETATEDAAVVLDAVERMTSGPTAVLSMPLGRLVGPDGTEVELGRAVVTAWLDQGQVMAALYGAEDVQPVVWEMSAEWTPEGRAAIAWLAARLESTD